jgi:hypothetical protein
MPQEEFDPEQVKFLMLLALAIAGGTVALIYQLA